MSDIQSKKYKKKTKHPKIKSINIEENLSTNKKQKQERESNAQLTNLSNNETNVNSSRPTTAHNDKQSTRPTTAIRPATSRLVSRPNTADNDQQGQSRNIQNIENAYQEQEQQPTHHPMFPVSHLNIRKPTRPMTALSGHSKSTTSIVRPTKDNQELTDIKNFISSVKNDISKLKKAKTPRPQTAMSRRSESSQINNSIVPNDEYSKTKHYVENDVMQKRARSRVMSEFSGDENGEPKLSRQNELNGNNFFKKMLFLGKAEETHSTVEALKPPKKKVDVQKVGMSKSMSDTNPSTKQDRTTPSIKAQRRQVFGEFLSAKQQDDILNYNLSKIEAHAADQQAEQGLSNAKKVQGIENDGSLNPEGLIASRNHLQNQRDLIADMTDLQRQRGELVPDSFKKHYGQLDEKMQDKKQDQWSKNVARLQDERKNPSFQTLTKEFQSDDKVDYKQFQKQDLKFKKNKWLATNPIATQGQPTATDFSRATEFEDTDLRRQLSNEEMLSNNDRDTRMDNSRPNLDRPQHLRHKKQIDNLEKPTDMQNLIQNVPNFLQATQMQDDLNPGQQVPKDDTKERIEKLKNQWLKNPDQQYQLKKINDETTKNVNNNILKDRFRTKSELLMRNERVMENKEKQEDIYNPHSVSQTKFLKSCVFKGKYASLKNNYQLNNKIMNMTEQEFKNLGNLITM